MSAGKNDIFDLQDAAAALGLLSRLPVPVDPDRAAARGGRAAWAWPVAGAVIALIAGLVGVVLIAAGAPPALAAGIVLAVQVIITGAMHEDGIADSADGLWGGWERERRLEIMKDSWIGAYGVLALILSLGLRWTALAAIAASGSLLAAVLAAAMLSRAAMAALMTALPLARPGGLARAVGAPPVVASGVAAGIAVVAAMVLLGWLGLLAALWVAVIAIGWGAIAKAKIGGQTGDILGAMQQLAEIGVLALLASAAV